MVRLNESEAATQKQSRVEAMRNVGPRKGVIQIMPPRDTMRGSYLREDELGDHDLVTRPLATPTGPGGAAGFRNVAGSQIAVPEVTNIYLGPFWGNQDVVEQFSKAVLENGYLNPLKDLGYGTGPGRYLGKIDGPALTAGTTFSQRDAETTVKKLLHDQVIHANANSLFVMILPAGVKATLDTDESCKAFCGYHDSVTANGISVAYAVLPSSLCKGCGGEIGDFTAVYAHELAEAATDKIPGQGWVAADGEENGDLEAWILFGWGPPTDPNRYTVQGYYTNERGNTVGQWKS
jgi:hypothetical protein